VVLLHGHPRTHTTWHRVAPLLAAAGHTVVCPDLRGYGQSSEPSTTEDHAPYAKRAMARDVVALMRGLGHERFAVVGHDRGSYVALRTALDHPGAVTHLAVLDCIPIVEHLDRADARFAAAWWHWFFFAQPEKPERAIGADPDAWYGALAPGKAAQMGEENHADFRRAIADPATVHAMLEDYRAGLTVDRAAEEADRPPDAGSPARRWCSGRPATTSRSCTATRCPSGPGGRRTCVGAGASTAATTWRRRPRRSWPRRWSRSSRADHG
jgi:haloacetate dehalogenase